MNQNNIRNFAIIAHIDHGKSTLADRFLELTGTIAKNKLKEQYLDQNPIGREHGITIKLAPATMEYKDHTLNLIDTPGHVDFSYEVFRTMFATEGAVLLVDATKGIQAQTVAHYTVAKNLGLTVIPVLNKIDLPSSDIDSRKLEIMETFGFEEEEILSVSAKTGKGVDELIDTIIKKIPPPKGDIKKPTQALIFDSVYNEHRGIVIYTSIKNGSISKGDIGLFTSDKSTTQIQELGIMSPSFKPKSILQAGEVGYLITSIKDITQAKVGDTITRQDEKAEALPGYKELKPFVFLSIYPASSDDFQNLRKALYSLKLNDAALTFSPDYSQVLGSGFKCGFLGVLHSQIVMERLEKEAGVEVYAAAPNVEYMINGIEIFSPKEFDPASKDTKELFVRGEIYTPESYVGAILDLVHTRRGVQKDIKYFGTQVKIVSEMPLANIVYDFYDTLKSVSQGFASFDYEIIGFRNSDLVKVDIALNEDLVEEFSIITHKNEAESIGRKMVENLGETIPKHSFVVNIQAKIGGRVIAAKKLSALSKNVTEKLYGGDITRKMKLREKQKEGKKKMKAIGKVSLPKEAFLSVVKK